MIWGAVVVLEQEWKFTAMRWTPAIKFVVKLHVKNVWQKTRHLDLRSCPAGRLGLSNHDDLRSCCLIEKKMRSSQRWGKLQQLSLWSNCTWINVWRKTRHLDLRSCPAGRLGSTDQKGWQVWFCRGKVLSKAWSKTQITPLSRKSTRLCKQVFLPKQGAVPVFDAVVLRSCDDGAVRS